MLKRLIAMAVVSGLMASASAADLSQYQTPNTCGWTNYTFAQFLANKYGIKIADTKPPMTEAAKYKALADALAKKNIKYFSIADPKARVKCCDVADVLYAVVGAKEPLNSCDLEFTWLIQNGYLKLPDPNVQACTILCDVESVFNNPLVIEKYQPPVGTPPPTNPPERHNEGPSSRI